MRLYLFDAFFVSHQPVTVPGRVVHVTGIVRPYVPGQWVNVKVFLGSKLFKRDRLRVKPSKKKTYGAFAEKLKLTGSGTVRVEIAHRKNAQQVGFVARRNFSVVSQSASFGCPRAVRRADPAAAGGASLLHPPDGGLRPGHRPRRRRLSPAAKARHLAEPRHGDGRRSAQRRRLVPGRVPEPRQARRGRPDPPAARADRQRQGAGDLPDQLRQAVDPDDPRPLPGVPEDAGLPARRDVLLELLHPAATPSTATTPRRTIRPATAACGFRSPTPSRSTTG